MRRTVPAAVTLLALATLSPGPAHAAAGPGEGLRCGYTSFTNPFAPGRQSGSVNGGPIVVADGADPRAGRIRCTIQVDAYVHAAADAVLAASLTTPGVAVLPETPVEYDVGAAQNVVLCTQVEIVGAGTFYWDGDLSDWSTSPYVACDSAFGDPPEPVLDGPLDAVWAVVDPLLCPPLAAAAPGAGPVTIAPDGDAGVAGGTVWDCPPYDGGTP